MTCRFCTAIADADAVYCSDCGEPFYLAEWRDPYFYVDEQRQVDLRLRFVNRGEVALSPRLLRVRGGDRIDDLSTRVGPVYSGEAPVQLTVVWQGETSAEAAISDLVCVCLVGEREVELPLPDIVLVPRPRVALRLNERSTEPEGNEDEPLTVELRPTEGYTLQVDVQVLNGSRTHLISAHLRTADGRTIFDKQFDRPAVPKRRVSSTRPPVSETVAPVAQPQYPFPWPPENHADWEAPAFYELTLHAHGCERPLIVRFRPEYLEVPAVQVLLWRPTTAGYAFVGEVAARQSDVTRERLQETDTSGLAPFDSQVRAALASDSLVQDTLEDLSPEARRIVWRVPRGKARAKTLAFHHAEKEVLERVYDRLMGAATLRLGSVEVELGTFLIHPDEPRIILQVELPPLEQSIEGEVVLRYDGLTRVDTYAVIVRVFEPKPFPAPVGIDFGTTNSCVALSLPARDGRGGWHYPDVSLEATRLLPLGPFDVARPIPYIIPTLLQYDEVGDCKIGYDVDIRGEHVFKEFKRYLNEDAIPPVEPASRRALPSRNPQDLTADFLTEVLRRTADFLEERGVTTSRLELLTCSLPTTFSEHKRASILRAYEVAQHRLGISEPPAASELSPLDESMAAFLFERVAGLEHLLDEQQAFLVLIYDFGGGTTDVTVTLARYDQRVHRWRYQELAAGGDANLGGEKLTEAIAVQLLGESSGEAIRAAEELKVSRQVTAVALAKYTAPASLTDDEAEGQLERSKALANAVTEVAVEWLRPQVLGVFDEVLQKTLERTGEGAGLDSAESLPLLVLLAGNSSKLCLDAPEYCQSPSESVLGFDAFVQEVLEAWIAKDVGRHRLQLMEVRLIEEAKACVAKGAYLSAGDSADIERPYEPHISYWLQLPRDARPPTGEEGIRVEERDGWRYLRLVPEGAAARDSTYTYDPSRLGLSGKGTYNLFRFEGVDREHIGRCLLPAPTLGQQLRAIVNSREELKLDWTESDNPVS